MAHNISAIVTKKTETVKGLKFSGLSQDLALLVDNEANRKALVKQDFITIWTDYFGGPGDQGCKLYKANYTPNVCDKCGTVLSKEFEEMKDINHGLKSLHVVRVHQYDEFDSINLGKFRSNEDISDEGRE